MYRKKIVNFEDLEGQIVAIKNPDDGEIMLRRVVATPDQWVMRQDDKKFLYVPEGHLWVESHNHTARGDDSLTKFGLVSADLV